ncbi:MAG: stage III sporulation protein AG [Christensenellales bacterium]|jgi:stage III sporulation protein AG
MEELRAKNKETPVQYKSEEQDKKERLKKGGLIASFVKLDIKKKIQYVAILLLIIVILTIYFSSFKSNRDETTSAVEPEAKIAFGKSVETRLKETLSRIEGAGRVEVMITYESSSEIVPALSVDTQNSTTTNTNENGTSMTSSENTQSEIVTINGSSGSSALVLREDSPEVKGVLVIAEGANDIGVKLNLLRAVQTVLNVSPDRVDVYKMNNE